MLALLYRSQAAQLFLVILCAIFLRMLCAHWEFLPNFSPVMVLCIGAGLWLGMRSLYMILPAIMLSDIAIGGYVSGMGPGRFWLFTLPFFFLLTFVASLSFTRLRHHFARKSLTLGIYSIGGAIAFYFLANTFSWLGNPAYPQTASGWWQANTTGLPGYPPSWTFFRNLLVGNLAWGLLFVAALAIFTRERSFITTEHEPLQR